MITKQVACNITNEVGAAIAVLDDHTINYAQLLCHCLTPPLYFKRASYLVRLSTPPYQL